MHASAARPSPRHKIQRIKERARYDRKDAYAILDAGFLAHVGFCVDGQPFVIPMLCARDGDALVLHGSIASRLQNQLAAGIQTCVSMTIVDGLVLARSHFHHSVNYRSVVAFGVARACLKMPRRELRGARTFCRSHAARSRRRARPPGRNELAATSVLHFGIADISAKIRSGGAKDDKADLALPHWAGVVPIQSRHGTPIPEADCADTALPVSVQRLLETPR